MSNPRIAAVISAVAGSTTAFLVTSKWHLAGTVIGAAIVPVIYTLVSHSSSHGVEHLGKLVRRSRGPKESGGRSGRSAASRATGGESAVVETPVAKRSWVQWWLAGVTCLALGFSIYALAVSDEAESKVVHETVIRTITVTSEVTQTAETAAPVVAQIGKSRSAPAATLTSTTAAADTTTTTAGSTTTTTTGATDTTTTTTRSMSTTTSPTDGPESGETSTTATVPADDNGSSTTTSTTAPPASSSSTTLP